ncbi:hypothetical protein EA472_10885 [Natrarchaeobius oligotrophus]|uniref:Uncharacterized protein n=1 Tax=Natrarchaeobius chitinivorans TaxID=1679083 RepID=A0A3N6PHX4_NATCH|nr:hypothetical protein EA472_10885 [Natrarchaeobius chitinivorans]
MPELFDRAGPPFSRTDRFPARGRRGSSPAGRRRDCPTAQTATHQELSARPNWVLENRPFASSYSSDETGPRRIRTSGGWRRTRRTDDREYRFPAHVVAVVRVRRR